MRGVTAELCIASYTAWRVAGHVVIFALGVHEEAGSVVFFRRESGDVFPPRFSLWRSCSNQPELPVLTPFSIHIGFQTTRSVDQVTILDAEGWHVVPVQPHR